MKTLIFFIVFSSSLYSFADPLPPLFKWMDLVAPSEELGAPAYGPMVDSTGHLQQVVESNNIYTLMKYRFDGKVRSSVQMEVPSRFGPVKNATLHGDTYLLGFYDLTDDIGLVRVDSDGKIISESRTTVSPAPEVLSLTVDKDGSSVGLIMRQISWVQNELTVLHFDKSGKLSSRLDFNDAQDIPDIYPFGVKFADNGNFYLGYNWISLKDDCMTLIRAISPDGHIVWQRTVKLPAKTGICSMFEGMVEDSRGDISVLSSYCEQIHRSNVLTLHPDGTVVWDKDFYTGVYKGNFNAQIHLDSNDGFVVSGITDGLLDMIHIDPAGRQTWELIAPNDTQMKVVGDVRVFDDGTIWVFGSTNIGHPLNPLVMTDVVVDKISRNGRWLGEKVWTPPTAPHPVFPSTFPDGPTDSVHGRIYIGGYIADPPNNSPDNINYMLMEFNLRDFSN